MRYELTKDLETGNATIDREHRELFDAVNKLMDACGSGKAAHHVVADKDNACAQKTNAGDDLGSNPGGIIVRNVPKTIFGNDHDQCGAQAYDRMGAHTCALISPFPLISDDISQKTCQYDP